MRLVLGFDGGGTKTDCVLMDESGAILARTRSGPSNPSRVALESALAALLDAAEKALAACAKPASEITGICGAVAGAGPSRALPGLNQGLQSRFPNATIELDTDLSMALAATGETPSVVIIAGTGSAVIGRNAAGALARDGGFGPVLGDPGSAYDIGRKAVILGLRKAQPGQNSYLGGEILTAFSCNWIELQDRIRRDPDSILPKTFPIVVKSASEGDIDARGLLQAAAADLSGLVSGVIEKLGLRHAEFFLATTGGVFGHSRVLDEQFERLVRQFAPGARIAPLPMPVAEFAARAALKCLDIPAGNAGD